MYSLPSTSNMCEPSPRAINGGDPPTPRKARTGELTPPGMSFCALWKSFSEDRVLHARTRPGTRRCRLAFMAISSRLPFRFSISRRFKPRYDWVPANRSCMMPANLRAAARELHHARGHAAEQKPAEEHALGEPRAEFQIAGEIAAQHAAVGLAGEIADLREQRFRRQIGRADRVVQTFAGDRIDQAGGIAHRHPPVAGHAIALPGCCLERRQQVAVERRALPRDAFFRHVIFQALAQRRRRFTFAADADREMAATRKHPDVAFEVRQKLDVDLLARRPARSSRAPPWCRVCVSSVPTWRSGLRAPVATMQKSASSAPDFVLSCQPLAERVISVTRAFSIRAPARSARSSSMRFRSKRE